MLWPGSHSSSIFSVVKYLPPDFPCVCHFIFQVAVYKYSLLPVSLLICAVLYSLNDGHSKGEMEFQRFNLFLPDG